MTVLFADLVGSTALAESVDPEAMRYAMDRYYTACRTIIRECGGIIEKFIGDAVMAVFGAERHSEYDARNAVVAASRIVDKVHSLRSELGSFFVNIDVHCGVASGEAVVTSISDTGARVVGDAVNLAARLESTASAGEVFVDELTAHLSRSWLAFEAMPTSLRVKGKSQLVRVYTVGSKRSVPDDPPAAFVGREEELRLLRGSSAQVRARRCCQVVTVIGVAGIGKTRLIGQFLEELAGVGVMVLRTSCQPDSADLTLRPLIELLQSARGGWPELRNLLSKCGSKRAAEILDRVCMSAQGVDALPTIEEVGWSLRALIQEIGKTQSVILVIDNLHWATTGLLEMLEDLVRLLSGVAVHVICGARTELLDLHPDWAVEAPQHEFLELEPLELEQVECLVADLMSRAEVDAQLIDTMGPITSVAQACSGNPLFAELLVAYRGIGGDPGEVPPSIRVILGAWLDSLPVLVENTDADPGLGFHAAWWYSLSSPPRRCLRRI